MSRVYFIQQGHDGPIKIGTADNPKRRLAALQCGNPTQLYLLASMPGAGAEERELHFRFMRLRIRQRGAGREWFHPDAALLDFVQQVKQANQHTKEERRRTGVRPPQVTLRNTVQSHSRSAGYEAGRQALIDAIRSANGNKSEAARRLGISRDGMARALRRYGLVRVDIH